MRTNSGFTLLEMLITLMILSSLFVLTISYKDLDLDYLYFINDYLDKQCSSLCDAQRNDLDNFYTNSNIYFNEDGNVNRAQTLNISNRNIIIHLGNGYLTYEK